MFTATDLKAMKTMSYINGAELKYDDDRTRIWLEADDTIWVEKFDPTQQRWDKFAEFMANGKQIIEDHRNPHGTFRN